jgi:hypothetical protein
MTLSATAFNDANQERLNYALFQCVLDFVYQDKSQYHFKSLYARVSERELPAVHNGIGRAVWILDKKRMNDFDVPVIHAFYEALNKNQPLNPELTSRLPSEMIQTIMNELSRDAWKNFYSKKGWKNYQDIQIKPLSLEKAALIFHFARMGMSIANIGVMFKSFTTTSQLAAIGMLASERHQLAQLNSTWIIATCHSTRDIRKGQSSTPAIPQAA